MMKKYILITILLFFINYGFTQSIDSKDCPVTIFYGLNESHSTDWAKCTSDGLVGISYYDKTSQYLYYKTIQPDGIENIEIVTNGEHLEISVLLLDSYSKPHIFIASSNDIEQTIKHYFKNINNQWENELVVSFYNEGGKFIYELSADIGIDNSFHLLILKTRSNPDSDDYYYAFINSNLYYVTNVSGNWQSDLVQNYNAVPTCDEYVKALNRQDITVDKQGFVHIVFGKLPLSSFFPSQLCYATNNSGTWIVEIASNYSTGTKDDGGWFPSLCLDNNEIPNISCTYISRVSTGSAMSAKLLFLTKNSNGTWNSEIVANADDGYYGSDGRDYTGGITHLVFDKNNLPHIIFSDIASSHAGMNYFNLGNIRHAIKENNLWNISTIYRQPLPSGFFNSKEMYSMCLLISENINKIQVIGQELTVNSSSDYDVELINIVINDLNTIDEKIVDNTLLFNYPNPFSTETTINFNLKSETYTTLIISDLKGEIISTIVDKKLSAGFNSVNFNAENLTNGIYFCKLITPEKECVSKMIMVK